MAAAPAAAQSWSFGVGVGVGGPAYYGAPPTFYEPSPYPRALPLSPDAVFDALEAAGYREFSPMAPRGDVYKLNAVNPRGDLVALVISAFTGAIESERILAPHHRPPRRASAPLPRPAPRTVPPQASVEPPADAPDEPPAEPSGDGGHDPLVVY